MAASGSPVVSPPIGVNAEITVKSDSLMERITPEELWACTSCKACDEICPVNIEILDKILDMRRYLSLMESNFPTELGNAYRSMENSSNPWGMGAETRGDWAKCLGVEILESAEQAKSLDWHFYVGSAQSFDLRSQRTAKAFVKILRKAGVRFAILGARESSTGECVRRAGNEMLF